VTDPDIPGALPAVWSSGAPIIATSGGTFLDSAGGRVEQFRVPELEDSYGRVRSPVQGSDGALYLITDNGDGADRLLKVAPRSS
jgi:glucose/arabinose dehydrogenase